MTKTRLRSVIRNQGAHIDALHVVLHSINSRINAGNMRIGMEREIRMWLDKLDTTAGTLLASLEECGDDPKALCDTIDDAHATIVGVVSEMRNSLFQADCQIMHERETERSRSQTAAQ